MVEAEAIRRLQHYVNMTKTLNMTNIQAHPRLRGCWKMGLLKSK